MTPMLFTHDEARVLAAATAALEASAKCDAQEFREAKAQAQGVAFNTIALVLLGINARCTKHPDGPVTINVSSPIGDRAEVGKSINEALSDYYKKRGKAGRK